MSATSRHSSVERAIGPDTTITLDFALHRLAGVIEKLVIYPETMLQNMNKFQGLVMSQRVLLALTQAGVSREDAYRLVQRNAMKVWEKGADFKTELLADPEVTAALSPAEIEEKFDTRLSHQARRHDLRPRLRHLTTPGHDARLVRPEYLQPVPAARFRRRVSRRARPAAHGPEDARASAPIVTRT